MQSPRLALAYVLWIAIYLVIFAVFAVASFSSHASFWPREAWGAADGTSEYCEPMNADSAVMEPVNAWSNYVTYVLLGAIVCALGTEDYLRLRRDAEERSCTAGCFGVRLRENPVLSLVCGVSWILLGVGSFFFHASHVEAMHAMDVGFTMAAATCTAGVSIALLQLQLQATTSDSAAYRAAITLGAAALVVVVDTALFVGYSSLNHTLVLVGTVGVLIVCEGIAQPLADGKTREQWLWSTGALCALLFGWCVRTMETSWGRPLCVHSSWFQPHAIWHAATALAMGLQVRAWRLPFPKDVWPLQAGVDSALGSTLSRVAASVRDKPACVQLRYGSNAV